MIVAEVTVLAFRLCVEKSCIVGIAFNGKLLEPRRATRAAGSRGDAFRTCAIRATSEHWVRFLVALSHRATLVSGNSSTFGLGEFQILVVWVNSPLLIGAAYQHREAGAEECG